jgi:hypothetical protein
MSRVLNGNGRYFLPGTCKIGGSNYIEENASKLQIPSAGNFSIKLFGFYSMSNE